MTVKNAIFLLKINNPPHPPPVGEQSPIQPTYNERPGSQGVVAHVLQHYVTAISGGSPPIAGVVKRVWVAIRFGGSAMCENHMSHDLLV